MFRSTVIMKTDLKGYTAKIGMLSHLDLSVMLAQHKSLITETTQRHGGDIVKGEGDSFWILFPSVTDACLAANEIEDELRASQAGIGNEERLAVRISITLGDVLHQEDDIFGEAVNLAARIETITPPDEIYLSHAAWLSLNKAEVETSYVGEYALKGFAKPQTVYKINRKNRTRIFDNQTIVFTDIHNYSQFCLSQPIEAVEELLSNLENVHEKTCLEFGGITRLIMGDAVFMTFTETQLALSALLKILERWEAFRKGNSIYKDNYISIGVNRGSMYQYRSALFGEDINVAALLESFSRLLIKSGELPVLASEKVRDELIGTDWEPRLKEVALDSDFPSGVAEKVKQRLPNVRIYKIAK